MGALVQLYYKNLDIIRKLENSEKKLIHEQQDHI